MIKGLKIRILNWLLKYLYNLANEEDFLEIRFNDPNQTRGQIMHGGLLLSETQSAAYGSEARVILRLPIWEMVTKDLKAKTNENMFMKSKNVEDMMFGKATLYTLDVIDKKLKTLAKMQTSLQTQEKGFTMEIVGKPQ